MRIDKVQQPERDMIVLSLRGGATAPCRLLISCGSGDSRIHLTEHKFDNPEAPPMFCMLLRKHLTGAKITDVVQPPAERVLELVTDNYDIAGNPAEKRLIAELVGRACNIILTDGDGTITDCLRRLDGSVSGKRDVLPGIKYVPPDAQAGKLDPLGISANKWRDAFLAAREKTVDKWLLSCFSALSPLICRELSWRAYGEPDFRIDRIPDGGEALSGEFFRLMEAAGACAFEPWMLTGSDNSPYDFSYTRILQYEDALKLTREESFSSLLDAFFTRAAQINRIRQKAAATEKTVKTAFDRVVRKLAVQNEELKNSDNRDRARECGDIIMANLHLMKKGQIKLTAQDFYSEDEKTREIVLDPLLTPQKNAAKYYKDYTKAKNAAVFLSEQIKRGETELAYLQSVLDEIALVENERDITEIREELSQTGYLRPQKQKRVNKAGSSYATFISSAGMEITAGRNNTQNDKLTLKTAYNSDVWLHAQKIHGAHVVISCKGAAPDDSTLREAAAIAAYYSAARGGGKTAVDYTLVKNVRKPAGGKPGMVIYTDYKTLIAEPDEGLAERLRRS